MSKRLLVSLTALLALLATAFAQDAEVVSPAVPEDYEPFGNVEVGAYEPWEGEEGGALFVSVSTPTDQTGNVDLVGPDGYWQHFEVEDEPTQEQGIGELEPGVYLVAATDDGLQLAATLVEVREGEAVRVTLNLERISEVAYDPADYPAYPRDYYDYGPYEPDPAAGAFTVQTDDEETLFVVTGPDNYSEDFEGSFTAAPLVPGST